METIRHGDGTVMGEYAEYALQDWARSGLRCDPNYVPRKRPRIPCPHCGKSVEASEGLGMHMKAKHPDAMLRAREIGHE